MGKLLIVVGLAVAAVGALIHFGVPLGKLPGDLVWRRGNVTVHFPIVTSIVVSVVLTLLLALLRR